jgi:hypothetical protein
MESYVKMGVHFRPSPHEDVYCVLSSSSAPQQLKWVTPVFFDFISADIDYAYQRYLFSPVFSSLSAVLRGHLVPAIVFSAFIPSTQPPDQHNPHPGALAPSALQFPPRTAHNNDVPVSSTPRPTNLD